jgi:uncharacterized protein YhfF
MNEKQQKFLDQYLSTLSQAEIDSIPQFLAEYFCADEYNANECARLINNKIKRASCSLKSAYDAENEPLPEVGRITVVLNWDNEPICIIRLTEVSISPFDKVTREFAESEGEGDGSYEWWREAHIDFFTKQAQEIDKTFDGNSELVLERFQKVFPQ